MGDGVGVGVSVGNGVGVSVGVGLGAAVGVGVGVSVAVGDGVGVLVGDGVGVDVTQLNVKVTVLLPVPEKLTVPPGQLLSGMVIVTVCGWSGESVPPGGLNVTLLKAVLADHARSPCEPGVSARDTVHIAFPFPSEGQLLPSGPTAEAVKVGAAQLHGTLIEFPPSIKNVRFVLAGQTMSGINTETLACWLPANVPLDGVY